MAKENLPNYIKISYRKVPIVLITILCTIFLLVTLSSVVILVFGDYSQGVGDQSNFFNRTASIIQNFLAQTGIISPNVRPTAIPDNILTPTPIPPPLTPLKLKTLSTTNPEEASLKVNEVIIELRQKDLPYTTIESIFQTGQQLLQEGNNQEALVQFKEAYALAQEILAAGEYYKKS